MGHAEDMTMRMTVFLNSAQQHQNMFLVDGDWVVSSAVKLTDERIDSMGYERLQSRLRLQQVNNVDRYYVQVEVIKIELLWAVTQSSNLFLPLS